ncbi:MAG TPA: GTPase HflX, partial [Clostridiales bacterium]|nr:GTPase HflX [Clostridiales bacterium]
MSELFEIKEIQEKFVLVAVAVSDKEDTEGSLNELKELASTAGAETVGMVVQSRESIHPGTYIGKGKIDEVRELVEETNATGVVCDDELSPAQLKNLEDALQTKVLDRTILILDIFAGRASTKEGKIQVELAQLRYRSTRLVGLRSSL